MWTFKVINYGEVKYFQTTAKMQDIVKARGESGSLEEFINTLQDEGLEIIPLTTDITIHFDLGGTIMRTGETKVYKFDELSKDAQQKAIQRQREFELGEPHLADRITDMFAEELESLGLPTDNIMWSLSYAQGDGVAFYGTTDYDKAYDIIDRLMEDSPEKSLLMKAVEDGFASVSAMILQNSWGNHYSHAGAMAVDIFSNSEILPEHMVLEYMDEESIGYDNEVIAIEDKLTAAMIELESELARKVRELSEELESAGYAEIEYVTSDEVLADTIRANDYDFYSNGEMA